MSVVRAVARWLGQLAGAVAAVALFASPFWWAFSCHQESQEEFRRELDEGWAEIRRYRLETAIIVGEAQVRRARAEREAMEADQ